MCTIQLLFTTVRHVNVIVAEASCGSFLKKIDKINFLNKLIITQVPLRTFKVKDIRFVVSKLEIGSNMTNDRYKLISFTIWVVNLCNINFMCTGSIAITSIL